MCVHLQFIYCHQRCHAGRLFPGENTTVILTPYDWFATRDLNPSDWMFESYRSYEDYLQISYELVRSGLSLATTGLQSGLVPSPNLLSG
jgi:hypothetical protein